MPDILTMPTRTEEIEKELASLRVKLGSIPAFIRSPITGMVSDNPYYKECWDRYDKLVIEMHECQKMVKPTGKKK